MPSRGCCPTSTRCPTSPCRSRPSPTTPTTTARTTFWPYLRDPETLARPWAIPGTPGLQHRIGGIEKQDGTGNVNYDPENHEHMVRLRAEKVAAIANDIPDVEVDDPDGVAAARARVGQHVGSRAAGGPPGARRGIKVAHAHLVHLNPFPRNLGEVLARYERILVPEMNLGQLSRLVRAEFLVDARSLSKVQGAAVPGGRDRGRDRGDERR